MYCRDASSQGRLTGFTLIELLVVMAIIIITTALAYPALREVRRNPIAQASKDFSDACREARFQAIMKGRPMQLVIRDGGAEIVVEPAPVGILGATNGVSAIPMRERVQGEGEAPLLVRNIHEDVAFRTLVVNQRDFLQAVATAIRFYPNGTCDQFDGEIQWLRREARRLSLEVMTGQLTIADIR